MPDPSIREASYMETADELEDLRSRRAWIAGLERTTMALADVSTYRSILENEGQQGIDVMKETLLSALTGLNLGAGEESDLAKAIKEMGGGSTGSAQTVSGVFTAQKRYINSEIKTVAEQLGNIHPDMARAQFPQYYKAVKPDVPRVSSVFTAAGGKVFAIMSNGGSYDTGLTAPVDRKLQLDPRTGDLMSINPQDPTEKPTVMIAGFGYSEVDPQIKFKTETAAAFAGLQLQRRGQEVVALGQDMANRIAVGRMEYDEATLELNRVDKAFNQRRADQQLELQYAVAKSSVYGEPGAEMTRLPLSGPLAGMLSDITGRTITQDELSLPVTRVNPNATGQGVLDASQFNSQIPGLEAQMAAAREAVRGITSQPIEGA